LVADEIAYWMVMLFSVAEVAFNNALAGFPATLHPNPTQQKWQPNILMHLSSLEFA
jgi:hypothetical protein